MIIEIFQGLLNMNILFGASENAWGGFFNLLKRASPQHNFHATGGFEIKSLKGFDVLIPTMAHVSEDIIKSGDCLRLIQQCGSGLERVDIKAARQQNIAVANVPTDISGNADAVAELGIYLMIGLPRHFRNMAAS